MRKMAFGWFSPLFTDGGPTWSSLLKGERVTLKRNSSSFPTSAARIKLFKNERNEALRWHCFSYCPTKINLMNLVSYPSRSTIAKSPMYSCSKIWFARTSVKRKAMRRVLRSVGTCIRILKLEKHFSWKQNKCQQVPTLHFWWAVGIKSRLLDFWHLGVYTWVNIDSHFENSLNRYPCWNFVCCSLAVA